MTHLRLIKLALFYISFVCLLCLIIIFPSCEIFDQEEDIYKNVDEIIIPTPSPRSLAFDGEYIWYSDDSLNSLNQISEDGEILKSILLPECRVSGFDFYDGFIYCINDTTILNDTSISHYPFSGIYKLSSEGEKLDTIYVEASVNPIRPEFLGLTIINQEILISSYQGWSSALIRIDMESKEQKLLHYHRLSGLAAKDDLIWVVDNSNAAINWVAPLDSLYQIIEDLKIEVSVPTIDIAFVKDDLWGCDYEKKLIKRIK